MTLPRLATLLLVAAFWWQGERFLAANGPTFDEPVHFAAGYSYWATGDFRLNLRVFLERLDNPDKYWKFNPADLEDRKLWNEYMAAYETALTRCSTAHAPWHVIPADRNWVRNGAIARIVRETLEEMNPKYPEPKGWDPAKVKVE